MVWGMMEECGAMLQKRHGFTAEQMLTYRTQLMQRFQNPYVIDSVTRVAREPMRKLSPNDRIIAPFRYAREYGLDTTAYYPGIAAVLLYSNPDDEQSVKLQAELEASGIEKTLDSLCAIGTDKEAIKRVRDEYLRMKSIYIR